MIPGYDPKYFYHPNPGDILDRRYELKAKIGWGTSSTVWLAQDISRWLSSPIKYPIYCTNATSAGDGSRITMRPSRSTTADMRAKKLLDTSWIYPLALAAPTQITEDVVSSGPLLTVSKLFRRTDRTFAWFSNPWGNRYGCSDGDSAQTKWLTLFYRSLRLISRFCWRASTICIRNAISSTRVSMDSFLRSLRRAESLCRFEVGQYSSCIRGSISHWKLCPRPGWESNGLEAHRWSGSISLP